jgi:hypothetical protein
VIALTQHFELRWPNRGDLRDTGLVKILHRGLVYAPTRCNAAADE